jgi:hypothetical protein
MNAHDTATSVLAEAANTEFNACVARAIAAGFEWVWDPEVPGVVGLTHPDRPRRAYAIVYVADKDFEAGEELEEEFGA